MNKLITAALFFGLAYGMYYALNATLDSGYASIPPVDQQKKNNLALQNQTRRHPANKTVELDLSRPKFQYSAVPPVVLLPETDK